MESGRRTMRLSVVIPVYNVEKTLDRCLSSVVACALRDMEIILVDDGSTDQSGVLCDKWKDMDSRVRVIHKSNGGLSDARNFGIEEAVGEYITFVDSDDYLADYTLEALMEVAGQHPEYDLIEYPISQFEGASKEQLLTFPDRAYTDVSRYWYETKAYTHSYAHNKVYRIGLFRKVRYPVGKVFEDIYTLPRLLMEASVVATCSKGLYHYVYNQHGITATAGARECQMLLDAHVQIADMPMFTAYNDSRYYLHLVDIQIYANELSGIPPVIADCPNYDRRKLKSILLYLLGIRNLCKLNRAFRRLVKRHSSS